MRTSDTPVHPSLNEGDPEIAARVRELVDAAERYRAMAEATNAGISIVDPNENILFANEALAEMLDYTVGELVGMNLSQIAAPGEFSRFQGLTRLREQGFRNQYQTKVRRQDGVELDLLVYAAPLKRPDGSLQGTLAVSVNITEQKRVEEALRRRNEELAALNALAAVTSRSLDLDEILETGLDKVLELLGLDVGGIYLAEPDLFQLKLVAHRGVSDRYAREMETIHIDEQTLEAITAESRLRRFVFSVRAVTKNPKELARIVAAMRREGLSLEAVTPVLLQAKEEILGLMVVGSRAGRRLSEAELPLLGSLVQQIAIGIQNAQLYQRAQQEVLRRAQAEQVVREERDRAQNYLDIAGVMLVALDTEGKVTLINKRGCEILGYAEREIVGKDWFEHFLPERYRAQMRDVFERIISGEDELLEFHENPVLTRDGRERLIAWHNALLRDRQGRAQGTLSSGEDITERRQAEEDLQMYSAQLQELVDERTRELREAQERLVRRERLAALGQLAGNVGHELRNPLGAINNAVYLLRLLLPAPDPQVQETLEIIESEVARSEKIISSLLSFARRELPAFERVELNRLVLEALSHLQVPENIQISRQLDTALPPILADPIQLVQAFGNILLNAIQAMPEGGRLTLKSEAIEDRQVAVSIQDTGVGIPPANLERIFEPLFTTKAKGIGLGLAICRALVEEHGGTVEVRSEVGQGSTFTIRLPSAPPEQEEGASKKTGSHG